MKIRRLAGLSLLLTIFPFQAWGLGFNSDYEAFSGDFNADGRTDIYVRKSILVPIFVDGKLIIVENKRASSADVKGFVLQQNSDKSFSIQSNLSSAQIQSLSQWASTAVELSYSDFNLDDKLDIIVKNVSSIVPGALDQVVYAPSGTEQSPQFLTPINGELLEFFGQVYNWIINPNYFLENASYRVTLTSTIYAVSQFYGNGYSSFVFCQAIYGNCQFTFANPLIWLPLNSGMSCTHVATNFYVNGYTTFDSLEQTTNTICSVTGAYITYVVEPSLQADFSNFNQHAISITQSLGTIFDSGQLVAQTVEAEMIEEILVDLLGVSVLEGVLSSGGILASESAGIVVSSDSVPSVPFDLDELKYVRMARLLGWALTALDLLTTSANQNQLDRFDIQHYTGELGRLGIPQSKTVFSDGNFNVFFTNDIYFNRAAAKSRLALLESPSGYFIFNVDEIPGYIGPPTAVQPKYGEPGGGTERIHPGGDASIDSYRWIPLAPP